MKAFSHSLQTILGTSVLAVFISSAFAAGNPNVDHEVIAFLQKLEASGGQPIEQLPPAEARMVLGDAQST